MPRSTATFACFSSFVVFIDRVKDCYYVIEMIQCFYLKLFAWLETSMEHAYKWVWSLNKIVVHEKSKPY
jgi:hypothetical protein